MKVNDSTWQRVVGDQTLTIPYVVPYHHNPDLFATPGRRWIVGARGVGLAGHDDAALPGGAARRRRTHHLTPLNTGNG